MQTQLIGYADTTREKITFAAGGDMTRDEQMKIWVAAKQQHKFPRGTIVLDLEERVILETAIFISDDVTEESAAFSESSARRAQDVKDKKAADAKRVIDLKAASKSVSDTAVARNTASTALNTKKQHAADAKLNSEQTKSEIHDKRLKAETALLEKAQSAFDDADKAWIEAKFKRTELEAASKI